MRIITLLLCVYILDSIPILFNCVLFICPLLYNSGEKSARTRRLTISTKLRYSIVRRSRGEAEGAQDPPLAIRIVMFIFLVFQQHCKSRSVHCRMFFGNSVTTQDVTTHLLSNPAVMNFWGLRDIEAAVFVPAWFVLPSITRAVCTVLCYRGNKARYLNY